VADAYLNVAERVILTSRRPLRPREIIECAYADRLLPWHLHGTTQDKTLQARISEDVAGNREASRFFRTAPGVFFLRELVDDPLIPAAFKQPYHAPPRRKELRRERVLTFDRLGEAARTAPDPFVDVARLYGEFEQGRYRYMTHAELARRPEAAVAHSFVLVFHGNSVLSYRCGKFSPETDPLRGMRSIGLGGAVYVSDQDMLFNDMFGIVASGINELGYGIGLSKHLSERARYRNEVLPCLAVLLSSAAARPAVVHVVLAYECPAEFPPTKAALSVNDLRWVDIRNPANTLDDFDETSRLLFATQRVAGIRAMVTPNARR
jgi:hypothetical protein